MYNDYNVIMKQTTVNVLCSKKKSTMQKKDKR